MYAYRDLYKNLEGKRCKGARKCVVTESLIFDDYNAYLFGGKAICREQKLFENKKPKVYMVNKHKKKYISKQHLLIKGDQEISKIKNIVKKVASVNEKKTYHTKESEEKLKTNYLKEVITLLLNTNSILK